MKRITSKVGKFTTTIVIIFIVFLFSPFASGLTKVFAQSGIGFQDLGPLSPFYAARVFMINEQGAYCPKRRPCCLMDSRAWHGRSRYTGWSEKRCCRYQ